MYNGIRLAEKRDIPALCEIWKNCFSDDSDDYIRFFYRENFGVVTTAVYTVEDRAVSMLHWFDASFADGTERLDAKYLYAGGTHPDYRHNGYYSALFRYVKDFAKKNGCVIFGKPASRDLIPYYQTLGFEPDACFKLVTVYPDKKIALDVAPLIPEVYNSMRDLAFSSHPYVRWPDRHVRFCVDENSFLGGRTLAVRLDGSDYFLMCVPNGKTLTVTETNLSLEQLRRIAGGLCELLDTELIKAYMPDYSCGEGEEIVSSIVYNAPLRNTYVNLILI